MADKSGSDEPGGRQALIAGIDAARAGDWAISKAHQLFAALVMCYISNN